MTTWNKGNQFQDYKLKIKSFKNQKFFHSYLRKNHKQGEEWEQEKYIEHNQKESSKCFSRLI